VASPGIRRRKEPVLASSSLDLPVIVVEEHVVVPAEEDAVSDDVLI
jgi:hypothetical protein